MEFHCRFSIMKNNASQCIDAFLGKFKPVSFCFAYENKGHEEGIELNPHVHAYLKYEKAPTKQQLSEFFKKQPLDKKKAAYYHRKQNETTEQNIIYTIKNECIISNNLDEKILNECKIKSKTIDEDKKLSSRDKILNRWKEQQIIMLPSSKFQLFEFIDKIYVLEFKKSPLAIGHKVSYSIYILMTTYFEIKNPSFNEKMIYEKVLKDLYNINYSRETLQESEMHQAYKEYEILKNKKEKISRDIAFHESETNADFIDSDENEYDI